MSNLTYIILAASGTIGLACLGGYYFTTYGHQWAVLHKRIRTPLVTDNPWHPLNAVMGLEDWFSETGPGRRVAEKLRVADLSLSPLLFVSLVILIGVLGTALLNILFVGAPAGVILTLGLLGTFFTTKTFLTSRRNHYLNALEAQMPEVTLLISNSLRAGLTVQQAFAEVARQMERPAGVEFQLLTKQLQLGLKLNDALQQMVAQLPSEELRLMLSTIIIQRTAGGNLAEAMAQMSEAATERFKLKDEIRTMTAEVRFNAIILVILPVVILGILNRMLDQAVGAFLSHPVGLIIFALFVGVMTLASFLINKLGKMEV